MFKNYLLIAWRNLRKSKGFSSINILGLALGMACSLLIALWVQDEQRVDAFHTNGSLVVHAPMAAAIRLPDGYQLVDLWSLGNTRAGHRFTDR